MRHDIKRQLIDPINHSETIYFIIIFFQTIRHETDPHLPRLNISQADRSQEINWKGNLTIVSETRKEHSSTGRRHSTPKPTPRRFVSTPPQVLPPSERALSHPGV
ncbi:hypothetical protein GWI33_013424 [Rhynchophorus ferrugineus]|uniref:Uncharacterized protein n=1 Tax=Rhynchophorus ferrugineus TaxID=354439 RepID=A0A834I889_RHYFE|nr:hypothetical protein GWI33_013424 [Rhynchophorus ferrugineus]